MMLFNYLYIIAQQQQKNVIRFLPSRFHLWLIIVTKNSAVYFSASLVTWCKWAWMLCWSALYSSQHLQYIKRGHLESLSLQSNLCTSLCNSRQFNCTAQFEWKRWSPPRCSAAPSWLTRGLQFYGACLQCAVCSAIRQERWSQPLP